MTRQNVRASRMKPPSVLAMFLFAMIMTAGCGPLPAAPTATSPRDQPPTPSQTSAPATPTIRPSATVPQPTETLAPLSGVGGGRIVFASKRDENYDIYVMNADGSDQRRLTYHPAEDTDPSWSPDGTRIAFTSYRSGHFEIYVMNADGSNMRRLTHGGGWGPSWSPDGSLIAFTRFDTYSVVFVMNADGSNQRQLTPTSDEISIYGLDWSPDGTQMVCVVDYEPSTIDYMDFNLEINILNIGELLEGTADLTFLALPKVGERVNDWPSWSPDGSQVVFSTQIAQHRDLYIVNADGSNMRRLTLDDNYDEFAPTWSPDGTRIAYQGSAAGGWDIYTINVDGTDIRRLTTDFANDVAPSWVP